MLVTGAAKTPQVEDIQAPRLKWLVFCIVCLLVGNFSPAIAGEKLDANEFTMVRYIVASVALSKCPGMYQANETQKRFIAAQITKSSLLAYGNNADAAASNVEKQRTNAIMNVDCNSEILRIMEVPSLLRAINDDIKSGRIR